MIIVKIIFYSDRLEIAHTTLLKKIDSSRFMNEGDDHAHEKALLNEAIK